MTAWLLALVGGTALTVLAPGVGARVLWRRRRARQDHDRTEDALKHLLGLEHQGRRATFQSLTGVLRLSDKQLMALAGRLEREGLVQTRGQDFHLTPDGERRALGVVRAHRLWETYLADEALLPLSRLHGEADRREHRLSADEVDQLDASLGYPLTDPHGDPIPTRDGTLPPDSGVALTAWTTEEPGCINHLEDEPPLAYEQILAEGLRVGQIVRVLDATPQRILLTDGEHEFRLAPAVAANVFVAPLAPQVELPAGTVLLSDLADNTEAEVVALDDACQGFTRRRLLDLGFTPGAHVTSEMRTFTGDPRAYRIRGVLIALRREQARQILARPVQPKTSKADVAEPARVSA
jgi:DtxR family Mn-dependent transcriptional regulator